MSLFFDTMEKFAPALRRGDLDACESGVAGELRKLAPTPFHLVLELSIANDPADAADHFDRFFQAESNRFTIGAAYTEMNGFDINTNLWYCDLFAYETDGGEDNHEWLCQWQSEHFPVYTIRGLESLQAVYASKAFREKKNKDASYLCSLLVVVKFQQLVHRAAKLMKGLAFPLYVTAHDFDFIAAVGPHRPAPSPPPEQLLATLIPRIRTPGTRFAAVSRLLTLGPVAKPAVPALLECLQNGGPGLGVVIMALAEIDPTSDEVVAGLLGALAGAEASTRAEIARALGRSATPAAINALVACLADPDKNVRYSSVIALKCIGRPAACAAPALRELLARETGKSILRLQIETALKLMSG